MPSETTAAEPRTDGPPPARLPRGPGARPRALMSTRRVVGTCLITAAAAVLATLLLGGESGTAPRPGTVKSRFEPVRRTTLIERSTVSGTLVYSDSRSLINRLAPSAAGGSSASGAGGDTDDRQGGADSATGGGGQQARDSGAGSAAAGSSGEDGPATLTAVAREGTSVRRNGTLYRLNDEPVILMYGRTPMYRTLSAGVSDGPDVAQLERNLSLLGYDPGTADDHFDASTTAAVERWQEASGLDQSGIVELGQVVFMPGARRIGDVKLSAGAVLTEGTEVMETTSLRQVVSIDLDTEKQSLARERDGVTVTLPSGRSARGRIVQVGSVAQSVAADSGAGETGEESGPTGSTISVTVALRSRKGLRQLDEAPVSVGLAEQVRKDVLAVPVTALLARIGGGYAVQVRSPAGGLRTIPVETGLFASGLVEIRGAHIRKGTKVAVPREI